MTRPMIAITDCSTGEEVVREMNNEEYAQHLIDVTALEAQQAEQS